jgi:hypothetical protein
MPIEVRIHPSVPQALRQLGLTEDFEQEVRSRIVDPEDRGLAPTRSLL